jgi:protein ATS1
MLYAVGSNGSGQLGVGHKDDLSTPQPVKAGDQPFKLKVKQFAAGGNHTVVLCEDGTVWATGNNEDGRCGVQGASQLTQFEEVKLPPRDPYDRQLKATHVAANWSATSIALDDGSIWTCGTGHCGELGQGSDVKVSTSLYRASPPSPMGAAITCLASGMSHTVAILTNGDVYGWGRARKGQLGHADDSHGWDGTGKARLSELGDNVWYPRKIDLYGFEFVRVACGTDFTMLVGEPSTGGLVFLLCRHHNDRFGLRASAPPSVKDLKDFAACWSSVLVLKEGGEVIGWGRADHGQLPPTDLPGIVAIAAGSEHCLALTTSGRMLAWGWGEHGNCGVPTDERGDVKGRWNQLEVPGRAVNVFAGCATSFIEVEND